MKFYAVLNKKLPLTNHLNALAHSTLGLAQKYPKQVQGTNFTSFKDGEEREVSYLTDAPFIILTAKNSNKLREFHESLISENLPHVGFYTEMIHGETIPQQIQEVKNNFENLDYVCVVTFGDEEKLQELTRKFSLYKN